MLLLEFCWIVANSKSVQMPPYHRLNVVIQTTCSYWNCAGLLPTLSLCKCTDYMLLLEFCWFVAGSKSVQMPPYHRLNVVIQSTCSYWNFAGLLPTLILCKSLHIIG